MQEQDQQTNQPTGPASKTSKQKQQARPAFWLLYRTKFRCYVGQFLGALLPLLHPSLPWGFAAGSDSIFGAAAVLDRDQQANQPAGQLARPDNKSSVFLFSGVGGRSGSPLMYIYIYTYVCTKCGRKYLFVLMPYKIRVVTNRFVRSQESRYRAVPYR